MEKILNERHFFQYFSATSYARQTKTNFQNILTRRGNKMTYLLNHMNK